MCYESELRCHEARSDPLVIGRVPRLSPRIPARIQGPRQSSKPNADSNLNSFHLSSTLPNRLTYHVPFALDFPKAPLHLND